MEVTTLTGGGHDRRVTVSAPGVDGSGTWFGPLPAAGESVDVELDVRAEVAWADIVVDPPQEYPAPEGYLSVRGAIVGLGLDGVLMLHTEGGAVVLVETTGEAPVGALGKVAQLTVRDVTIYPTADRVAPLIVTLDGRRIAAEADIHLAFRAALDLGPDYGDAAAGLQDRLGDGPRPLHVTWTDARRSETALGRDLYGRYAGLLADLRARDLAAGHADPFTYEIRP